MTSFSAISEEKAPNAIDVTFVVFPGMALLDLTGPLQVLSWARDSESGLLAYDIRIVSVAGGRVPTCSYITVDSECTRSCSDRSIDTLIVVGGDGVYEAEKNKELVREIARLAGSARRVCSVCSGAYLLASAGLLIGRRAVTHWEDVEILKRDFPDVRVETDPIYVKDDNIWTSAGVTSGIDMSIAIVAEDQGTTEALKRAQALVTYMARPGGQSQFSPVLERQKLDTNGRFNSLHLWIEENLQNDLSIENLADFENMSVRTFHRAYQMVMGVTPARAVSSIRLERARDMLETSSLRIKEVAFRCGFKNEQHMRRRFLTRLGVTPTEYRDRFKIL